MVFVFNKSVKKAGWGGEESGHRIIGIPPFAAGRGFEIAAEK
jgi:hypothetical protein